MRHRPVVTGGGRPKTRQLQWPNTGLGNLKGAINGTYRSCDAHHTDRYLAAYKWRFNRRFALDKNLERLARRHCHETRPSPNHRRHQAECGGVGVIRCDDPCPT